MSGFDPDKYLGVKQTGSFDPDAYLRGNSKQPAPKPKLSFWDTVKQQAAPDIFKTGDASYELGGKVTDATGSPLAGYLTNVASQALPVVVGAFGGSTVGKPLMEGAARRTMQSAVKPLVQHQAKAPAAIETMLKGGFSPTIAGFGSFRDKAAALTGQVDDVLSGSNKAIDLARALQNVSGVADKARTATMGVRDADTALDVGKQLLAHPSVDDLGTMSVQAAQAMKKANYKSLGDAAYGIGLKPAAERDAIKAVTAALRKNIERAEPAVAPINKELSEIVNALKVASRRASMEGNKDILPLGASIATAVNNPVAALGMYANSSAAIKGMLARMLYSGAQSVPAAIGGAAGGALGASGPQVIDQGR